MEVALIGKGPGKELAPKVGSGIVTWGVNDIVGFRECDVCFFMDKVLLQGSQMDKIIKTSVNKTKTRTYCTEHFPDIPTSVPYPLGEVEERFGVDYWSDSCCYMIALALLDGFETISLYGFNYSFGGNYEFEKPGVMFWLGVALGLGVTVNTIGDACDLYRTKDGKRYAYQTSQELDRKDIRIRPKIVNAGTMSLSVKDRVALRQLLKIQGSYSEMSLIKRLDEQTDFNIEERKKLNFRHIDVGNGKQLLWDDADVEDIEIILDTKEFAYVRSLVKSLDVNRMVNKINYNLYEKFCVGG